MTIEGSITGSNNANLDDEVRLTGMSLTIAMSEWMKAKDAALASKKPFTEPRPNSRAYLDLKGAELIAQREKIAKEEQEKMEAQRKKNPDFFEKISNRPEEKQVLGVVEIKKEIKKEKKKYVESILSNPENLKALKEMLGDVYSHRPNPEDFIGAMDGTNFESEYSRESVFEDLKSVQMGRTFIEMKNQQFGESLKSKSEAGFEEGEILQTVIIDRVNKGWIPDMKGIMTCDFDDLKSGIDSAMRYKESAYFGVSLDMTIAEKTEIIEAKLQKNWDRYISKGHVPVIKYYIDPENPKDKGKRIMPKFVIGGSHEDLNRLANAYLNDDLESVADDPLKYTIISQIDAQLSKIQDFYSSLENISNPKFDFARKQYARFADFFEEIKKSIDYYNMMDTEEIREHRENNAIYRTCKNFVPKISQKLAA